jgi:hypothetical protein
MGHSLHIRGSEGGGGGGLDTIPMSMSLTHNWFPTTVYAIKLELEKQRSKREERRKNIEINIQSQETLHIFVYSYIKRRKQTKMN